MLNRYDNSFVEFKSPKNLILKQESRKPNIKRTTFIGNNSSLEHLDSNLNQSRLTGNNSSLESLESNDNQIPFVETNLSFLALTTASLTSIAVEKINSGNYNASEIQNFVKDLRNIASTIEEHHRLQNIKTTLEQQKSERTVQLMLKSAKTFIDDKNSFKIPDTVEQCILAAHKINPTKSLIEHHFNRSNANLCLDKSNCKYHNTNKAANKLSKRDLQKALICKFAILGKEVIQNISTLKLQHWQILLECQKVDILSCCKYLFVDDIFIKLSANWGNLNEMVDVTIDDFKNPARIFH